MFTLAHLSDPHLRLPGAVPWPKLVGKRLLGYLACRYKRAKIHDPAVLATLIADVKAATPDHIAVTGDLTNLALPDEFTQATDWLHRLGTPDAVTVVPGNHDAYVATSPQQSLGRWAAYMAETGSATPPEAQPRFPFVRRRGEMAIVGVSSACPTPIFCATGRLGDEQLAALTSCLEALAAEGLFRTVLVHHPPVPGLADRRKGLTDAPAFGEVIRKAGAELILHGHNHQFSMAQLPTPNGFAPVIGVPSASARPLHGCERAAYHLYRIVGRDEDWQLEVEVRGFDDALGQLLVEDRFELTIPRGPGSRSPRVSDMAATAAH